MQQRVTVRRSCSNGLRRDHAAGTGTLFNDDRLAERVADLRAEQARDDIRAGTDHDADHAMRIILRMRPAAHHQERQQGSEQSTHHAVFLLARGNFRATRADPRPPHDRDGRRRS